MKNNKNSKSTENARGTKKARQLQKNKKERNKKIILWSSIAVALLILVLLFSRNPSTPFSHSQGIDENGFWEGNTALDYVELFDYRSMTIPSDVHAISDADVQDEIDSLLENYEHETKKVANRAVANGDKVNIDYVGSVDGVEFEGGSTGGMGTEVTAGSTNYIDDFLTQIIEHRPGSTINVRVTFPEDYGQEHLNGKEALFVTTINYIAVTDITDKFVEENLYAEYGWKTVSEMREGKREELKKTAIQNYITEYIQNEVTIIDIPDSVLQYQENSLVQYVRDYAGYHDMTVKEFLERYEGVSTIDELLELYRDDNFKNAVYSLVIRRCRNIG